MILFPPAIQLPPARYLQGDPPAVVRFMEQRDVTAFCRSIGGDRQALACAFPIGGPNCTVIMPTWASWGGTRVEYANLSIHEAAHCHGWPANHPKE